MSQIAEVLAAYQAFPAHRQSLMLSTINSDGTPNASYAPFVVDDALNFYIYISGLSTHTQNLHQTGKVSALLIDDESTTPQIFARRRLTYDCNAQPLEPGTAVWEQIADHFETRFGNIIQMLRQLGDFQIFKLTPYGGRFVVGFGAAYDIDPADLRQLKHSEG